MLRIACLWHVSTAFWACSGAQGQTSQRAVFRGTVLSNVLRCCSLVVCFCVGMVKSILIYLDAHPSFSACRSLKVADGPAAVEAASQAIDVTAIP